MKIQKTRTIHRIILAISLMLAATVASANEELLGSSSSGTNPASLYSIDATTGAATLIGSTGLVDSVGRPNKVAAIALDPQDGTLYGIFGSACTGARLITIDPSTGAGTPVGFLVGAGFNASNDTGSGSVGGGTGCHGGSDALVFGDDGTLYAGGWNGVGFSGGTLLTVDKITGAVLTAQQTTGGAHIAGLAKASDGTIWVSRGNNTSGLLHTIDTGTGAFSSTLALSEPTARISDIAFGADGTLYGSEPNAGMLVTIDTVTGTIANVGAFESSGGAKISGLTLRGAEVPIVTCTEPEGCNLTGGLNVEISPDIPIPEGTTFSQTVLTPSAASQTDDRVANGTCGQETLVLFGDDPDQPNLVIPPWICGTPFVVIESETELEILNGTIVLTNEGGAFFETAKTCEDPLDELADGSPTDPFAIAQIQDEVVHMTTDGDPRDLPHASTTTFECGSSRGRGHSFSYNVVGMSINFGKDPSDTEGIRQAFVDLGHYKFHVLWQAVLNSKEALPKRKWRKLVALSFFAKLAYHVGWYEVAVHKLTLILNKVDGFEFDTGVGFNHEGNITEKADNLRYYVDKYVIGLEE